MPAEKLKLKKGCRVHPGTVLYEGCTISENLITANVSAGKVKEMMLRFAAHGIGRNDDLVTAWFTFTRDTPR